MAYLGSNSRMAYHIDCVESVLFWVKYSFWASASMDIAAAVSAKQTNPLWSVQTVLFLSVTVIVLVRIKNIQQCWRFGFRFWSFSCAFTDLCKIIHPYCLWLWLIIFFVWVGTHSIICMYTLNIAVGALCCEVYGFWSWGWLSWLGMGFMAFLSASR